MAKKISTATLNFNGLCKGFLNAKNQKKEAVALYEALRKEIIDLLGDNNAKTTNEFIVTYNVQNRDNFNLEQFKMDHPKMYTKYLKTTTAWTLNVTKKEPLKRKK